MITSGAWTGGRAAWWIVVKGKGVAKPACLPIQWAPFFYSPGCVTAPYPDTSEALGDLLAPEPTVRTGALNIFHGRKGELHRAYHAGMEDQLGALGLVLNCVTLWNTLYLDRALSALRAQGYPVTDAGAARLSAYQYRHINVHGHYSFALPDLGGNHRPLRDPDAPGEE